MKAINTKVKSVQANGTWESKNGLLYKFDYEFEDGVVMGAMHKTEQGFHPVGSDVGYIIKGDNTFGKYGTVGKPEVSVGTHYRNQNMSGHEPTDTQLLIVRQSCLKLALEFLNTNPNVQSEHFTRKGIKELSEDFVGYIYKGIA